MRALVTGGTGFLGSYLVRFLADQGTDVIATHFSGSSPPDGEAHPHVEFVPLDVNDSQAVARVVSRANPDVVYHFAGQAFVIASWEDPSGTFGTNLMGTLHLLEEIRRHRPRTRFAFAGSGTEYGDPPRIPTPEDSPLRPTSPYAASKAAADLLCYQYFRSFEIPVFRYRIFGTTGPGKRGDSTNDFASQIAALERKAPPRVLRVGTLDKKRDITDVRDATRAMVMVVERGEPGEAYNIASGIPREVRHTLQTLLSFASVPIEVQTEPSRIRLVDEPVHLADVTRLTKLGWRPQIPFEQTLRDVLASWRQTA